MVTGYVEARRVARRVCSSYANWRWSKPSPGITRCQLCHLSRQLPSTHGDSPRKDRAAAPRRVLHSLFTPYDLTLPLFAFVFQAFPRSFRFSPASTFRRSLLSLSLSLSLSLFPKSWLFHPTPDRPIRATLLP